MKLSAPFLGLVLVLCGIGCTETKGDLAPNPASATKIDPTKDQLVTISNAPSVQVKKGQTASTTLKLKVVDGFHIQSNPAKPRLIPTTLKLEENAGLSLGEVKYPVGKTYRLKGAEGDISVYEGAVELEFTVKAQASAKPGTTELSGKLRYQACNDITCFFPKTVDVKVLATVQ